MKTQQLLVFVTVAREKSLRGAARRLQLTSPGIMRTIQELEVDLGVPLMTRSSRGIELTDFGRALESRANQLLHDIRRAREELQQMNGKMIGEVKFGCSAAVALTILGTTLTRFRETAPLAQVSVSEERLPLAAHRVRDGSLDFVASHGMPGTDDGGLRKVPLFTSSFIVMACEQHPLIHATALEELLNAEWFVPASYDGQRHSIMADAFSAADLPIPKRITRYTSFSPALGLVADASVIGIFPAVLRERLACLGLRQIALKTPLPEIETDVVMRDGVPLTPVSQHFLNCLVASAKLLSPQSASIRRAAHPL